jgi:hypothetical protein
MAAEAPGAGERTLAALGYKQHHPTVEGTGPAVAPASA